MCRLQGAAQRRSGGQGMVAFASDPYTNSTYAVKFYFSTTSFQREKSAITHPALERAMPAWCAPPHQWLDRDFPIFRTVCWDSLSDTPGDTTDMRSYSRQGLQQRSAVLNSPGGIVLADVQKSSPNKA